MQENESKPGTRFYLTYTILILIILVCAVKWFLQIGFRINYYDILILFFLCAFMVYRYKSIEGINLPTSIKIYLQFMWGWFFLEVTSGLVVVFFPAGTEAASFFAKGLIEEFILTLFFSFLLLYLCTLDDRRRSRLVYWYVAGTVVSSIYGFLQIALIQGPRINTDVVIASWLGMPYETVEFIELSRQAIGQTFRLTGLTGDPSVHAAYTITALPLLLYNSVIKHRTIAWLPLFAVILSLALSMSGSGISGMSVALICFFVLQYKNMGIRNIRSIAAVMIIIGGILLIYSLYQEEVVFYSSSRFAPGGSILSHLSIAIESLNIGLQRPLGVGLNNYSIAMEMATGEIGFNAHNVWITYFVELGVFGLLYRIAFSAYIVWFCLRRRTALSAILASSYIGLCVAGMGYQTMNRFYIQLYIALFYAIIALDGNRKGESLVTRTTFLSL